MNKESINNCYRNLWIFTITEFIESDYTQGAYFWLRKNNNNYQIYWHKDGKLINNELNVNDEEIDKVKNLLINNGFEIRTTENNNTFISITKKEIIKFINEKKERIKRK